MPKAEATYPDAMPMREVDYGDGEVGREPDFAQVTPERAVRYLDEESGMESTDVDKFVANMIAKSAKAVEEHSQKRPEMGEDEMPGRFSQRLNEWKRQGEELQTQKAYWDAVNAERERVKSEEVVEAESPTIEAETAEPTVTALKVDESPMPEASEPMTESQRKAAENIATKLGYTIEWHDTMPENGRIDYATRTIHLAKDAENPLVVVFGHETYHEIARDSEARDNVQNFAKSILGEEEFERRVNAKQERYSNLYGGNRTLMEDEVVADFFGKIVDDNDLLERVCWEADHKILAAINRVLDKILSSIGFKDAKLIKAKQIVADAYESAINRYKESKRLEFERTDPDETGVKAIEATTDEPIELYNIRTEEELREKIRKWADSTEAKKAGWAKDNIEDIIKETGDLFNFIHSAIGDDPNYAEFAKKKPTMKIDWRDNEMKPTVTWARANVEYKYDVSGDLLCIKNQGIEQTLSSPIMAELMLGIKDFKSNDVVRLYEVLGEMGFVIPCKGCYDAAARFKRLPGDAQKFAELVNSYIDKRNKDPKKFDEDLRKTAKVGDSTVDGLPTKAATKERAIEIAVAGDNITEHIDWREFMTADGQTNMLSKYSGLMRAWQRTGTGRPKDKLLAEPYNGVITEQTFTILGSVEDKTPSFRDIYVNNNLGMRRNSHSEFRPTLVIDEMQFYRDSWLKNLWVFKYTKDLDDVRLFRNFGTKYNISIFPAFKKGGVAPGLDENANYIYSDESAGATEFPIRNEKGIIIGHDGKKGFEEAKKLVGRDCSLSMVAFSMPHFLKLLTDVPTPSNPKGVIGSIIPYHAGGASYEQILHQGLGRAVALSPGLNVFYNEAFTDYKRGVTNFEAVQNDRFEDGWVRANGKKKGTNVPFGTKIEFATATVYRNDKLGLTFYSSPKTYQTFNKASLPFELKSGHFLVKDSEPNVPIVLEDYNDVARRLGTDDAYKLAADNHIKVLRENGFIPRFDFTVPKDVFVSMCKEAKVDPNDPTLGWKGGDWTPADAESYYSVVCDYGMTDPATGKYSPQRAILEGEKDPDAFVKALPKNFKEIIEKSIRATTEREAREGSMVNDAVREYTKRSIAEGRISLEDGNAILSSNGIEPIKQEDGVLYSKREGNRQSGEVSKGEADKSKKAEFEAEKAEIKAKAEASGTFLKAPNGKDTNLTPDEYTTVRTKSFKGFFGDWVSAKIKNFLLNGEAVAGLKGDEFSKQEGMSFKQQVVDFFNAQGGTARSALGEIILDVKGVKNSMGHGLSRLKSVAFAAVKDVLENGVVLMPMDYYNIHGKKQQTGVISAPITIDGERYICMVEVIRNRENNRLYTHEVTLQKNSLTFVLIRPNHKVKFWLLIKERLQIY